MPSSAMTLPWRWRPPAVRGGGACGASTACRVATASLSYSHVEVRSSGSWAGRRLMDEVGVGTVGMTVAVRHSSA